MLKHLFNAVIGHVSGLSDAQLEQIEQALPATGPLIDLLIKAQPFFEQAQTLHTEAEPLIDQVRKEADGRTFGTNRLMSVAVDSTIAPIFAGGEKIWPESMCGAVFTDTSKSPLDILQPAVRSTTRCSVWGMTDSPSHWRA
jgi:hypothetical protein